MHAALARVDEAPVGVSTGPASKRARFDVGEGRFVSQYLSSPSVYRMKKLPLVLSSDKEARPASQPSSPTVGKGVSWERMVAMGQMGTELLLSCRNELRILGLEYTHCEQRESRRCEIPAVRGVTFYGDL